MSHFNLLKLTKLVDTGTKEESDVDVALNLEAESQRKIVIDTLNFIDDLKEIRKSMLH